MKHHHNIGLSLALGILAHLAMTQVASAANNSVDITVRGAVPALCEVRSAGAADSVAASLGVDLPARPEAQAGPLSTSGSASFDLNLSCNSAFQLSVQSQNGGFQNTGSVGQSPRGFTSLVPYRVNWQLRLDDGSKASAAGCDSLSLRSQPGCGATTGQSAMRQQLTASLVWDGAPASAPPIQGDFKDVMTIRLTAIGW